MPKECIYLCEICESEFVLNGRIRRDARALCPKCKREGMRVARANFIAKKLGNRHTLTLEQWIYKLNFFEWKCAYCRNGKFEVLEHFKPSNQGGGTTYANCFPACFMCNSMKRPMKDHVFKHKRPRVPRQSGTIRETLEGA